MKAIIFTVALVALFAFVSATKDCGCSRYDHNPVCTSNGQMQLNPCVAKCYGLTVVPCPKGRGRPFADEGLTSLISSWFKTKVGTKKPVKRMSMRPSRRPRVSRKPRMMRRVRGSRRPSRRPRTTRNMPRLPTMRRFRSSRRPSMKRFMPRRFTTFRPRRMIRRPTLTFRPRRPIRRTPRFSRRPSFKPASRRPFLKFSTGKPTRKSSFRPMRKMRKMIRPRLSRRPRIMQDEEVATKKPKRKNNSTKKMIELVKKMFGNKLPKLKDIAARVKKIFGNKKSKKSSKKPTMKPTEVPSVVQN
jgi:hypothetical protein